MGRLGAHMSIAGGLARAIDRAVLHGCEAAQIFTRATAQWRSRPLSADEVAEFRRRSASTGVFPVVAHASYLINLASDDPALRARSIEAFGEELDRAERLGLLGVVLHPGSGAPEHAAVERVASALLDVLAAAAGGHCLIILEHTAGQGMGIGHRFEHLAAIIAATGRHRRIGVCLDTCHLHAAGYDIVSARGYRATFEAFDRLVGLDRLQVLHLNDAKKSLGSRVDRHAHIGQGMLGLSPFRRLVNDTRFETIPMLLETPKTEMRTARATRDPLDVMNLETLHRLRRTKRLPAARRSSTSIAARVPHRRGSHRMP